MTQVEKIQILLVEETEKDLIEMKRNLADVTDFEVETIVSYSYEEAAFIFKEQDLGVCFVKAKINNQSGNLFLKKLNEDRKQTPIVLVYEEQPDEKMLADDGVNEYVLRKNLSPDVLNKSIRHAIENNEINLQLEATEEKYSRLFYSSLEPVFTINENYEIIECNKSFRELLKVTDLKSFNFREVFLENSEDDLFGKEANTSGRRVRKKKITNTDGEEIIAYFSVSPITSEIEEANYLGIIHDVTELENAQAKLAETDKLEMIQRMARIIGHEVRNPLTNIFLATEEIKQDLQGNEDALFMLEMIHRNSSRISTLIDNFLKNAHTKELVTETLFIESVLEESIKLCGDRIVLKQIDFTKEGFDRQTPVQLDLAKISIAFTNILINAVEALENTENPKLSITISQVNDSAQVVIKDNGKGMSEETKKNLFTPFFSNKQGGLGLGMSNAYGIFKAHNAKVIVESELDVGTSFIITMPIS